ncbi:hypothetical protein [Nocardia macrotermitis]|uniref:Uncharacterized protein n=1 Tax=Nocardia macrotermitis TaxID=2585198 RepID=A0A7K0D821_9NOCA|nr:hypothetical protein [Nocardia macrotermitis]MQY21462.1 hypothetical protein [Nocardia macrotermitis]
MASFECRDRTTRDLFTTVGFHELDVRYEQPETTSSGTPTPPVPLHLLYKPFGRVYEPPLVPRADFLTAITEIYRTIYEVDTETDSSFARLLDSLGTRETIPITE